MAAGRADDIPATGFTVFLDRDGVFNMHPPVAVRHWREFHWLPGAKQAFAQLNRPDVRTCLCTNQPTVGLLLSTPGMVNRVNSRLQTELAAAGGELHHVEAAFAPTWLRHRRRKPRPGMLEDGAAWLKRHGWQVDKARAVMVGDKPKDAMAGNAFGVPAILLATSHDETYLSRAIAQHGLDAVVVSGLPAAVQIILERIEKS